MKNKIPLIKNVFFIVTAVSLSIWLLNSCRKDTTHSQSALNNTSAVQAEFGRLGYSAKLLSPLNDTSRIQWVPHWNQSSVINKDSITYTYIPLTIAMQHIKTGKVDTLTITTKLIRYIIVETVKKKNSFLLATYLNTDTAKNGLRVDFSSFTGTTFLESLNAGGRFLANYRRSKTVTTRSELTQC